MKLTEMRELLDRRGIQLTKSLGQNFLHDSNQLGKIAALARLQPGDHVLEIGPGLGPLTEVLLSTGARVRAIEKDHRLCPLLLERFAGQPNLELRNADALAVVRRERDWAGWKLVSNLPYSVGSPILVDLAMAERPPELMVATLQLEVVQRIMAPAGTEHYGQLSLFVQLRYEAREWFKIPATCFFPPPDVESACVLLCRRQTDLLPAELARPFMRIVKRAFSERRKMLAKLLKHDWPAPQVQAAFEQLGLDPQIRAERVSPEQFAFLTRALATAVAPPPDGA
jgi:16S rRNA (adenine1518-N6/adenine1519-N6)-dimethyltransferase